jgi:hypothetical protein
LAIVVIGTARAVHEYCWRCRGCLGCWQKPLPTPILTAVIVRLVQPRPPSPHPSFCCSRRSHLRLLCPTLAVRACSLCCY